VKYSVQKGKSPMGAVLFLIYIIFAFVLFKAQLQNGFATAFLTAVFWPIVIPGMALVMFFQIFYAVIKK
jgi:hypothetical protein